MTTSTTAPRPRRWTRALPALALTAALLPISGAQAAPETDIYCRSNPRSGVGLFVDYAAAGARLRQIERDSGGNVELGVAGQSFHGRDIRTARVGHGDEVVVIQSQIHGNEKHGPNATLNLLEQLGANTERAAEIREQITLVAIPMLNPDGSELDKRQNDMSWEDTVALHPQLEGAPPAWYHNAGNNGFDVNRDFNPDFDYVPDPADLPGDPQDVSFFLTPESQAVRDLYLELEDEFGTVEYWVDLHNQGPCYRWGDEEEIPDPRLSYLSVSSEFVDESRVDEWPLLDLTPSRQAAVAIHDTLQYGEGTHQLSRTTRYPPVDLPGSGLGAFSLRGTAVVLFETSGSSPNIGHQRINLLVQQLERGLNGFLDMVTDGSIHDLDPDRFFDIPTRGSW